MADAEWAAYVLGPVDHRHRERSGTSLLGGLVVAIVATESEARWLVAELSRALHHEA